VLSAAGLQPESDPARTSSSSLQNLTSSIENFWIRVQSEVSNAELKSQIHQVILPLQATVTTLSVRNTLWRKPLLNVFSQPRSLKGILSDLNTMLANPREHSLILSMSVEEFSSRSLSVSQIAFDERAAEFSYRKLAASIGQPYNNYPYYCDMRCLWPCLPRLEAFKESLGEHESDTKGRVTQVLDNLYSTLGEAGEAEESDSEDDSGCVCREAHEDCLRIVRSPSFNKTFLKGSLSFWEKMHSLNRKDMTLLLPEFVNELRFWLQKKGDGPVMAIVGETIEDDPVLPEMVEEVFSALWRACFFPSLSYSPFQRHSYGLHPSRFRLLLEISYPSLISQRIVKELVRFHRETPGGLQPPDLFDHSCVGKHTAVIQELLSKHPTIISGVYALAQTPTYKLLYPSLALDTFFSLDIDFIGKALAITVIPELHAQVKKWAFDNIYILRVLDRYVDLYPKWRERSLIQSRQLLAEFARPIFKDLQYPQALLKTGQHKEAGEALRSINFESLNTSDKFHYTVLAFGVPQKELFNTAMAHLAPYVQGTEPLLDKYGVTKALELAEQLKRLGRHDEALSLLLNAIAFIKSSPEAMGYSFFFFTIEREEDGSVKICKPSSYLRDFVNADPQELLRRIVTSQQVKAKWLPLEHSGSSLEAEEDHKLEVSRGSSLETKNVTLHLSDFSKTLVTQLRTLDKTHEMFPSIVNTLCEIGLLINQDSNTSFRSRFFPQLLDAPQPVVQEFASRHPDIFREQLMFVSEEGSISPLDIVLDFDLYHISYILNEFVIPELCKQPTPDIIWDIHYLHREHLIWGKQGFPRNRDLLACFEKEEAAWYSTPATLRELAKIYLMTNQPEKAGNVLRKVDLRSPGTSVYDKFNHAILALAAFQMAPPEDKGFLNDAIGPIVAYIKEAPLPDEYGVAASALQLSGQYARLGVREEAELLLSKVITSIRDNPKHRMEAFAFLTVKTNADGSPEFCWSYPYLSEFIDGSSSPEHVLARIIGSLEAQWPLRRF